MMSAPLGEPAGQASTAKLLFAATIASPSVQSPAPPGLGRSEVTTIVCGGVTTPAVKSWVTIRSASTMTAADDITPLTGSVARAEIGPDGTSAKV
jgi:hypothetical protein